jgi:Spy/CpxP family protein refolding chaperone
MKSLMQRLCLVGLAVVIALPLVAQDDKKKDRKKDGGMNKAVAGLKKALSEVSDITPEQQKKIDAVIAEYTPKLQDAAKKAGEGPKKLAQANKKLKDEGKTGKELKAAAAAEAKLTADEQAGVDEVERVGREMRNAVGAILTDAQKEKAGLNKGGKKKKDKA